MERKRTSGGDPDSLGGRGDGGGTARMDMMSSGGCRGGVRGGGVLWERWTLLERGLLPYRYIRRGFLGILLFKHVLRTGFSGYIAF